MRLNADEIVELKEQNTCKVWRLAEPKAAVPGKSYLTNGTEYTVGDCNELLAGDVMRKELKQYRKLRDELGASWERIWCVSIVLGDLTNKPNLLAYSGFGDAHGYSDRQRKTKTGRPTVMADEPEAISRVEAKKFALAVREAYALKREEKRRGNRKQRYENKVA